MGNKTVLEELPILQVYPILLTNQNMLMHLREMNILAGAATLQDFVLPLYIQD